MIKYKNLHFRHLEYLNKWIGFVEYDETNIFIDICEIEQCGSEFELKIEIVDYCEMMDDLEQAKEIANMVFHEIIYNCLNKDKQS